jgi:5-methylcytosine-specific restriction endonuclease McrA
MTSRCVLEGCDKPVLARGMCKREYSRWKRHGTVEIDNPRIPRIAGAICIVPGCELPATKRDLCNRDYAWWQRYREIKADRFPRFCGWCQIDISEMHAGASFCSRQHMRNDAGRRFRERNPGYYKKYKDSPARITYREENKELLRSKSRMAQRAARLADPEGMRDRAKAWWDANQEKHRFYQMNRRVAKIGNPGSVGVSERDWLRLVNRMLHACFYCDERVADLHMEHVIPLSRGGRHAIGNIVPACASCNLRKSASFVTEWMRREMIDRTRGEVLVSG